MTALRAFACVGLLVPGGLLPAQTQFRELVRSVLPPQDSAALCLTVGDVDRDGMPDLVLGQANGQLRLYLQTCPGSYRDESHRLPPGADTVQGVVLLDLDRDGDLDLAVATARQVRILVNRAGTFVDETSARLPITSANTRALVALDADRDGDLDLFAANLGQNALYLNDGAGVFTDVTTTRLPARPDDSRAALAGDVDRDGDLDLFVGNNGGDALLRNDGQGTFADASAGLVAPPTETVAVAATDIDRDGDQDLLTAHRGGTRIYWNGAAGWFTSDQPRPGADTALAVGDVDRDGWPDLCAVGLTSTSLYLNDHGRFGWLQQPTFGRVPAAPEAVRAATFVDLDLDADLDLVLVTASGTRIYFNDGLAHFMSPPDRDLPELAAEVAGFAAGDADGDGDIDLLLLNTPTFGASYAGYLLTNDGRGTFTAPQYGGFARLNAAVFADVDGDGYQDIVGADDLRERLYIFNGTYFVERTEQNFPAANDQTTAVAAGDIDGDGDLDLVFGNYGQSKVYVNRGPGVFFDGTPGRLPIRADLATAVALADLDGDGDLDLVIANYARPNRVLRNDGAGRFTDLSAAQFAAVAELSQAVAVGDVDGDGDRDILFGGWGQSRLYRNDGSTFTETTATALPVRSDATNAIALGDVDDDGDLDAVLGGLGQDRIYINDGRGSFTDATSTRLGTRDDATRALALLDTDRDGDLDLVTCAVPGRVRLFANLTRQVHIPRLPQPGCAYDLDCFAEPWRGASRTVVPFLAGSRLANPVSTPFGLLGLDPASVVPLAPLLTSAATGSARLQFPVPANTALRGLVLHWQALVRHGATQATWRLTNLASDRIGS